MQTTSSTPENLAQEVIALQTKGRRFILGIAGAPAAGKSYLANRLVELINQDAAAEIAVAAPMDGFHRTNYELSQMGIWEFKGVPASFSGDAFIEKLAELKYEGKTVGWPTFDRAIEEPTPDGTFISPHHQIVIVEGNYLLLDYEPWSKALDLLDTIWFIESDEEIAHSRLLARHIAGGKTPENAEAKIACTDAPNAKIIEDSKVRASKIISLCG